MFGIVKAGAILTSIHHIHYIESDTSIQATYLTTNINYIHVKYLVWPCNVYELEPLSSTFNITQHVASNCIFYTRQHVACDCFRFLLSYIEQLNVGIKLLIRMVLDRGGGGGEEGSIVPPFHIRSP